ncbi:MAG TPA: hypothetical protein VJJ82_02040 [Candidatus Nanoarchaeia archaeon]|nr:hypothetical protein [Candidatus Nanoarchaeia archaeon]
MWPINYNSVSKFTVSIGAGLVIAAFLIYLQSSDDFYTQFNQLEETRLNWLLKNETTYDLQMAVNQSITNRHKLIFLQSKTESSHSITVLILERTLGPLQDYC